MQEYHYTWLGILSPANDLLFWKLDQFKHIYGCKYEYNPYYSHTILQHNLM